MILKIPVAAIRFVSTNSPGSSYPVNLYRPSSAACGRHLPRRGRLRSFPSGRCVAQRIQIIIAAGGSYTIKSDAGSAQPRLMRGSRDWRDWKARANSYYLSSKGLLENNLSLRTSAHTGVAIPRIFKHLGSKTKLFPFNRGAATPVTSVYSSQRHAFLTAPYFTSAVSLVT